MEWTHYENCVIRPSYDEHNRAPYKFGRYTPDDTVNSAMALANLTALCAKPWAFPCLLTTSAPVSLRSGTWGKLPFHTLRIARPFVTDMTTEPEGLVLASTVSHLAPSVKPNVLAEGIEAEHQSRLIASQNHWRDSHES
jgi:hypothetical protein